MASNSSLYDKIVLNPSSRSAPPTQKMYRGFSTISGNTENFALYDLYLIQQDILNHFNTRQGERLMNPEFGCVIWDLMYEPLTSEFQSLIVENVNRIINYDPRVAANQVLVTSYQSGIQIECILTYLSYNVSQKMQLRFDQANGLMA